MQLCLVYLFLPLGWGSQTYLNPKVMKAMWMEPVWPLCLKLKVISTLWCCWEAAPWPVCLHLLIKYICFGTCVHMTTLLLFVNVNSKKKKTFLNKKKMTIWYLKQNVQCVLWPFLPCWPVRSQQWNGCLCSGLAVLHFMCYINPFHLLYWVGCLFLIRQCDRCA